MSDRPDNHPNARNHDARLRSLLQQWHPIETTDTFNASVWQRIRAEQNPAASNVLYERFTPRWIGLNAAAAAAGLILGVGLALTAASAPSNHTTPDQPLLRSQTLAGSYLTLVTGETR